MNDSPFTAIGDEPVEARIVAWVLGEASTFEIAELERLCEERPELLVFRRRMRALHGLLTEAEAAQPDEGWKLPPEKRKVLDEIFGSEKPLGPEVEKEKRIRRSGFRAFLAIAACVMIAFVILSVVPRKYRAEAIIEVKGPAADTYSLENNLADASDARTMSPQFFGTEFEKIKSRSSLEKVVENLELTKRWNVDKEAAMARLKSSIETKIIRGTDQISIGARDSNPEEAKEIVQEVAAAYQEYRTANDRKAEEQSLTKLREAVQNQEDKVEERRKVLSTMARTKGIIYKGDDTPEADESSAREEAIKRGLDAQDYADARRDFETDQQLLQAMKLKLIGEDTSMDMQAGSVEMHKDAIVAKQMESPIQAVTAGIKGLFASGKEAASGSSESIIPPSAPAQIAAGEAQAKPSSGTMAIGGVAVAADAPAKPDMALAKSKPAAMIPNATGAAGGFGGGHASANSDYPELKAMRVAGLRSGDQAINRNSIDAILNNPARPADVQAAGEKGGKTTEEMPVLGKQYADNDQTDSAWAGRDVSSDESGRMRAVTRSSAANTNEPSQNVDQVRRNLHMAEGNYNLGKYDDAKREYEDALRTDPYNQAARRGLERIAGAKTDYYRAAYDHTRAELLSQVDNAWELSVPAEGTDKKPEPSQQPADHATDGDKSNVAEAGKLVGRVEIVGGAKFELQTGGTSAYHFKGAALSSSENAPKLEIVREFQYPTEYEPPVIPDSDSAAAAVPKTPLASMSWTSQDEGGKAEVSAPLLKAMREQEEKVEERRKVLATIVRTKGIIHKGNDSFYGKNGVDEDQGAKNALQAYHQLEQEKIQLESQLKSLQKYDSEQLMVYASGLDLPDNAVSKLYPKYVETKRQLEAEKANGLGNDHPSVKAKLEQTEAAKRQIDESVANLKATLNAQLDLTTNRLKTVEAMKNETRDEAIKRGLNAQDYADAKREFETEQALLQQMKLKFLGAPAKTKPAAPKVDLTKLMEEISATEDPYSTFSLNISDASFQIAQAALAKGEQPDPAGIKVEQFYNAVDYGDPAPSAGEPVAVAIEQSAHPVIPGRNLVRVALKTAAAGRSASQALRLTLLVDQSGSMVREDRRAAMEKALAGLAGLLTENDSVSVVGFSRTPRLLADSMPGNQANKLAGLVNQSASEGGTNLEEAIKLAEQMAERNQLASAQNRIVLFTDGAANLGNADPVRLAERVKVLRQKGIAFDIAGIAADGLNDELLGELARNGNGRYYVVGKGADDNFAKQLAGAFRPAAENVKVQVRFNPERVGRYKLIGFEKDRLKTEDFRNDAVDAAELAAEEAGVAVYQVETLPAGNGELGEVSVRFRDAASAQMVERTWAIPHDSGAPAIDRATPSMQLAVLSMLAAEKLKGGPLAEAIDFQQLADPRANVKRFYGNNGRVGEVLHMLEALK